MKKNLFFLSFILAGSLWANLPHLPSPAKNRSIGMNFMNAFRPSEVIELQKIRQTIQQHAPDSPEARAALTRQLLLYRNAAQRLEKKPASDPQAARLLKQLRLSIESMEKEPLAYLELMKTPPTGPFPPPRPAPPIKP